MTDKRTAANNVNHERAVKENNALIAAPLNSLADLFERYKEQQHVNDKRRERREIATIIGVFLTALFTVAAAVIFYFQLNQMRIATRHADEAARTQHSDTLDALQKAQDANALAKATAERQAVDTAQALAISKESAEAALVQAGAIRANLGHETILHPYNKNGEENHFLSDGRYGVVGGQSTI